MTNSASMQVRIPVGVSSCLLGEPVRFDGGHKRSRYVAEALGEVFEFIALCPEAGAGLGTPRQPIRLVGAPEMPRAVGTRDPSMDVTDRLLDFAGQVAPMVEALSGYIFKRGSPSCGMERVKVYGGNGMPASTGVGVFARAVMAANPLLPVEEEGRLMDPVLRENFVMRVFVYHRWRNLLAGGLTAGRLVEFHSRHKLLLLAHSETRYRRLGRMVARAGVEPLSDLAPRYAEVMMDALARRATRKRHANVLMHLTGYLKRSLDPADRQELAAVVDAYRRGRVPLVVPMTLLKHHFRRRPDGYIARQHYMQPHPEGLSLRNAV